MPANTVDGEQISSNSCTEKAEALPTNENCEEYDVIVIGAGYAGVCQARHLLLKKPGIKIALIDINDETEREKSLKVGESMIEIATMFVNYELQLYEYMIDNHPPKFGLSYHWPKCSAKTEKLSDYVHVWANRSPQIQSYHLKRSKFEADVLKMNREMGCHFIKGKVKNVDITTGEALNTVDIKGVDGNFTHISSKYIIDAAGRSHIIGRKFNNIVWDAEIKTGAFWVRISGVDRDLFLKQVDQYQLTSSPYYSTNHWFGVGHWMWQIPIDKEKRELSIGVVHQKDVIESKQINTLEKFMNFVKNNHNIVYQIMQSGTIIDSHYWSKLAFQSKELMHKDGWFVIGDSAAFFDPFYSIGTTMIALQVETMTNAILTTDRTKFEQKITSFNSFHLNYQRIFRKVVQHFGHCHNASVMSARIFFDFIGYFGFTLPMYCGKYHLTPSYCTLVSKIAYVWEDLMDHMYSELDEICKKNIDIGFMDYSHSNQLLWSTYSPSDMVGEFLPNGQLQPKRLDISYNNQHTCWFILQWYSQIMYRAYGVTGLMAPKQISVISKLSSGIFAAHLASWWHWVSYYSTPDNTDVAKMQDDVSKVKQSDIALQSW